MLELNKDNWEKEVNNSNIPVLVDFYTNWCGPCRALTPMLEKLSDKLAGKVKFGKVNTDESEELAVKYGITSIPQLLLFAGTDQPKHRMVGLQSEKDIMKVIDDTNTKRTDEKAP